MDTMTKIDIITNSSKFDELKDELNKIGIAGMTVSSVYGCGLQKGHKEYYRGVAVDINLLPKIKVEIIVSEVPVKLVTDTAQRVLKTGKMGDGKIFVYNVQNVIRISTGQEGKEALKGEE